MTEQETLEGNKLIAKFIYDDSFIDDGDGDCYCESPNGMIDFYIEDAKYHSSWDWLMPIYTKINRYISERCLTDFVFATNTEQLHLNLWMALEDCSDTPLVLWFHVVEFIKWYNQNKI